MDQDIVVTLVDEVVDVGEETGDRQPDAALQVLLEDDLAGAQPYVQMPEMDGYEALSAIRAWIWWTAVARLWWP